MCDYVGIGGKDRLFPPYPIACAQPQIDGGIAQAGVEASCKRECPAYAHLCRKFQPFASDAQHTLRLADKIVPFEILIHIRINSINFIIVVFVPVCPKDAGLYAHAKIGVGKCCIPAPDVPLEVAHPVCTPFSSRSRRVTRLSRTLPIAGIELPASFFGNGAEIAGCALDIAILAVGVGAAESLHCQPPGRRIAGRGVQGAAASKPCPQLQLSALPCQRQVGHLRVRNAAKEE